MPHARYAVAPHDPSSLEHHKLQAKANAELLHYRACPSTSSVPQKSANGWRRLQVRACLTVAVGPAALRGHVSPGLQVKKPSALAVQIQRIFCACELVRQRRANPGPDHDGISVLLGVAVRSCGLGARIVVLGILSGSRGSLTSRNTQNTSRSAS